jgi:hypothetical protein
MNNATATHTEIPLVATQQDVVRILEAQYAHMDQTAARAALTRTNTQVWSNDELMEIFEVSHFDPPYVHVIRKTDGQRGTVAFINKPRLYFAFQPEETNDSAGPPRV